MTTTTFLVIAIAIVALAIVLVVVVRARRRGAQASERMGLPPIGTMSGDPIDDTPSAQPNDVANATKPPSRH